MIGSLRGVLRAKHPPQLLIEVGGIGYELEAPMSTFYELPGLGEGVCLLVHQGVREEVPVLYGFLTEGERGLFRNLLRISGIGAKMALAILSGISVEGLARCVRNEDVATLVKVPGVGRKTAERLIIEMRDRVESPGLGRAGAPVPVAGESAADEAFGALVALGYKPAEATRMIRPVATEGLATEEIIRKALQGAVK